MSAKAEKGDQPTEDKPKKSNKKLVILVVAGLVTLVGGAGVATMFMAKAPPPPTEHSEEEVHEPEPEVSETQTADLGQFIVNLSDMGSFLKIRIMIEYDAHLLDKQLGIVHGEEGGEAHGGGASGGAKEGAGSGIHTQLAKKEHHFRDTIIRILSAKKASDLLTVEGKVRLKEELLDGLNESLGLEEPAIVGILFTDFMIQ